jgi:MOSC domain-containing protein
VDAAQTARVADIFRFPVKSMQGEQPERAAVTPGGLVGDRGYAVVDAADGKVASAKNPAKWSALLACRARFAVEPRPDEPLPVAVVTLPDGSEVASDDPAVHGAISAVVGRDARLTSEPLDVPMLEEVWPDIDGLAPDEFIQSTRVGENEAGEVVSGIRMGALARAGTFVDVSPLHLLTTATLGRLGELAPEASFDPRRYRPNVLVDVDPEGGAPADGFVENDWVGAQVALGDELVAAVTMATMRCVMTTLAHDDLAVDRATLRTIARHNRVAIPNLGTWACAGVYAAVTAPGTVAVGDPVQVHPPAPAAPA